MIRMLALVIVFVAALGAETPAQRLVSSLSDKSVSINSSFAGETLTLFGNVEPDIGAEQQHVEGPFNVIMVIRGPALDRAAREKTREFGIWLNSAQLVFKNFPSYFWVLSSAKLEEIADADTLEAEGILPETRPLLSVVQGNGDPETFGTELVRLMTEAGLFGINERGVTFASDTLYSARLTLPADVPNGNFLATTYLFKDGKIVSRRAEGFAVRKTGLELLVGSSARQYPLFYGLTAVVLAVFTGWLGGVAFRR